MKPRDNYREIPHGSQRYWTVDLQEPKGLHGFRFPGWAMADKVQALASQALLECEAEGAAQLRRLSPWMGLVIGSCWWHRGFDLSTAHPGWRADDDALLEYGEQVASELMDHDYRLLEVSALYSACSSAMRERLNVVSRARERADFSASGETAPPESSKAPSADERGTGQDGSTSSPQTSGC